MRLQQLSPKGVERKGGHILNTYAMPGIANIVKYVSWSIVVEVPMHNVKRVIV